MPVFSSELELVIVGWQLLLYRRLLLSKLSYSCKMKSSMSFWASRARRAGVIRLWGGVKDGLGGLEAWNVDMELASALVAMSSRMFEINSRL